MSVGGEFFSCHVLNSCTRSGVSCAHLRLMKIICLAFNTPPTEAMS